MFDKLKDLKNLTHLKDKVEDIAEAHGGKISEGLEKVGGFIDDKTGRKHSGTIDTAVDKAQGLVEKLGDKKA
ncbi:antitoxin [Streptomyces kebangsaanensis]|uniref:Antitoxin n=1 Tax=Streptomyces kebangsaanensis TaxID=864058 RepID=A0ABW6L119_9ACTN